MTQILLVLALLSAGIYLVFSGTSLVRRLRNRKQISESAAEPYPAYFWGLAYTVLFYYGFPVWLWRYGLKNTLTLIIWCLLSIAALQASFRYAGLIEVEGIGESIGYSLLIAVPVRAVAGWWVAQNDRRLRQAIISERKASKRGRNGAA